MRKLNLLVIARYRRTIMLRSDCRNDKRRQWQQRKAHENERSFETRSRGFIVISFETEERVMCSQSETEHGHCQRALQVRECAIAKLFKTRVSKRFVNIIIWKKKKSRKRSLCNIHHTEFLIHYINLPSRFQAWLTARHVAKQHMLWLILSFGLGPHEHARTPSHKLGMQARLTCLRVLTCALIANIFDDLGMYFFTRYRKRKPHM